LSKSRLSRLPVHNRLVMNATWVIVRDTGNPVFRPPCGIPSLQWYNIYTMEFEYDPAKSEANRKKHGIDFIKAQALWDDPDLIEIPAKTTGETRFMIVAKLLGKHWSAIITWRRDCIRIISVRRSRQEEVEIYEG
jgi:uncharacterized DUF497 family protein